MRRRNAVAFSLVGLVLLEIAAWGCSRPTQGPPAELSSRLRTPPTLRVLVTGDVAGTIEPCGCVKDQLGGLDRFATAVANAQRLQPTLFVEAGSLLFSKSTIDTNQRAELSLRAETLARVMHSLNLLAWAPGKADFALGEPTLRTLAQQSGAKLLQSSTQSAASAPSGVVIADVASIRVGLFGLDSNATIEALRLDALANRLQQAGKEMDAQGVRLKIAVLNVPPGAVARIAQKTAAFQVLIVGGSSERSLGADSDGAEPQLVGTTLVVEPPNHLRGLVAVDFTVIGGQTAFQDGTGVGRDAERIELGHRISELTERVQVWKQQNQDKASIAAREADLQRLQQRSTELSKPIAIPKASYFTIQNLSIGNNFQSDPRVSKSLNELGRKINRNNFYLFADRKAPPAAEGQPSFVGVTSCETCHEKEAKFWRATRHAGAYQTLADKDRQYTLACVGCHVTGYAAPGGSTVTDVDKLKDVQCENCHGAGSIHAKMKTKDTITRTPARQLCANRCHHSPHVAASWKVDDAWPKIIGEGHGR